MDSNGNNLPPPFRLSRDLVVNSTSAHFDKIDLWVNDWAISLSTAEDALEAMNRLGSPDPVYEGERRSRISENHHEVAYGTIFLRANLDDGKSVWNQSIRKATLRAEDGRSVSPPLFSGKMVWKRFRLPRRGLIPFVLKGSLNLTINPTRALRHRRLRREIRESIYQEESSTIFPPFNETCFSGEDNWLPLSRRYYSRDAFRHYRTYLDSVIGAVTQEVSRVTEMQHLSFTPPYLFTVKSIETYWEFTSDNPTALVEKLLPALRAFSAKRVAVRKYAALENVEIKENMRVITAQTAQGQWLKIYAKTNRRIRIEVRHRLTGTHGFRFPRIGDTRSSRHRFGSTTQVRLACRRAVDSSTKTVNEFFSFLRSRRNRLRADVRPYDALCEIFSVLSNHAEEARTITQLLVENGRLHKPSLAESYKEAVELLKKRGILAYHRRGNSYSPTSEYVRAFEALRNLETS